MHEPDLEKLRRLSLAVGLIILTSSFAGISVDSQSSVTLIGIPFKIAKPELLPLGLIIVSIYGTISFYYYGFMLKKSPYRIRRDLIDELIVWEPDCITGPNVPIYFGPVELETSISYSDRETVENYVRNFPEIFPKFARARASVTLKSSPSYTEDGEPYRSYNAKIIIPKRCRVAAIFHDIDYASPIWLNIFALLVFTYKIINKS